MITRVFRLVKDPGPFEIGDIFYSVPTAFSVKYVLHRNNAIDLSPNAIEKNDKFEEIDYLKALSPKINKLSMAPAIMKVEDEKSRCMLGRPDFKITTELYTSEKEAKLFLGHDFVKWPASKDMFVECDVPARDPIAEEERLFEIDRCIWSS